VPGCNLSPLPVLSSPERVCDGEKGISEASAQSGDMTSGKKQARCQTQGSGTVKESDFRVKYKPGKTLGTGAFSVVKVATNRETKEHYAVKIIRLKAGDSSLLLSVERELAILKALEHHCVLKYVDSFSETKKVYIVTELLQGGELLNSLVEKGSYTEEDARTCFVQLLKALEHIHSKGIIHRDLKLENLLLRNAKEVDTVKLADFGMAKYAAEPEEEVTVVGTPMYVAPEVLSQSELHVPGNPYHPPVDMWGAGVILYILLVGYPPFFHEAEPTMFAMIKKGEFSLEGSAWDRVSPGAKDLVSRLLSLDPAGRLSAAAALEHPWCQQAQAGANLEEAVKNLQELAGRKLKGAVKSIVAIKRMNLLGKAATGLGGMAAKLKQASDDEGSGEEDEEAEDAEEPTTPPGEGRRKLEVDQRTLSYRSERSLDAEMNSSVVLQGSTITSKPRRVSMW